MPNDNWGFTRCYTHSYLFFLVFLFACVCRTEITWLVAGVFYFSSQHQSCTDGEGLEGVDGGGSDQEITWTVLSRGSPWWRGDAWSPLLPQSWFTFLTLPSSAIYSQRTVQGRRGSARSHKPKVTCHALKWRGFLFFLFGVWSWIINLFLGDSCGISLKGGRRGVSAQRQTFSVLVKGTLTGRARGCQRADDVTAVNKGTAALRLLRLQADSWFDLILLFLNYCCVQNEETLDGHRRSKG